LYLMRLNYKLLEAKNGLEGLGVAKQFEPHLIITDLTMPVMDGIALVKAIRADDRLKKTPIIVITGTSSEFQTKASEAGADAVLNKPVVRRDLIEIIEVIFMNQR
jgi:CheY-like chemotaxis protein